MDFPLIDKYHTKVYPITIWTSAIVLLSLFVFRIALIFSYSAELYGIDNNFVYSVQRIMQGYDLYTDPEQLPYAINMYSPLFFSISAFIGKTIHINPDEPICIYQLCRSVSFLCDIITCCFLYRILRVRYKATKETSLLTTSIFAAILCFWGYTFSRSDSMILTFYGAFIYVLTVKRLEAKKNLLIVASLSVACIFSKQSGIIIPVIAITWLWIQNKKISILFYLLFFLTVFAGMIALYRYGLSYTYFFENTFKAIQNRVSFSWFYVDIFKRTMNSLWILPFYGALLLCLKQWTKKENREDKAFSAIYFIHLFFSLTASLKIGSSVGYLAECLFLSLIIIVRHFLKNESFPSRKQSFSFLLPLIFLFTIHTIAQGYLFFIHKKGEKKALYQQQKEIKDYLQPQLGNNYIFNMYYPNTSFFKTLFSRNLAAPNFDIISLATFPDGTFDYSQLEKDFNNGNIKFLLTSENDAVTSIWNISLRHYIKDTVINGYAIYRFHQP